MRRHFVIGLIILLCGGLLVMPSSAQSNTVVWEVEYFPNFYLEGSPAGGGQIAGSIALVWRDMPPTPGVSNNGWTARFTGNGYFPAGRYRFRMLVDDGAALRVSGVDLFSTLSFDQHSLGCPIYADMTLNEGFHQIQITYLENNGDASLFFDWQPLSQYTTNDAVYHGCNPPGDAYGVTDAESAAFNSDPLANPRGADFSDSVYGAGTPQLSSGSDAPVAASTEDEATTANVDVSATAVTSLRVIVGTLNVRSAPASSGSNVLGKASFGDVFAVTGAADGWYAIDFGGQIGYVSSRFVSAG
ncbi:MAG: SH3 domain-containing protein [Chloroflexota bacterium]